METTPPVQLPQVPIQKSNKVKGIFMFEIGLLELVFVLILLTLAFGTLNYFRIINLDHFIPQLSFLPQQSQDVLSINKSLAAVESQSSLTAQQLLLNNIANQLLIASYRPPSSITSTSGKGTLSLLWEKNNVSFETTFEQYTPQLGWRVVVLVRPTDITRASPLNSRAVLTTTNAQSIADTVFQINGAFSPWSCAKSNKRIFCQKALKTPQYKVVLGVGENQVGTKTPFSVVEACIVSPTNKLYTKNISCL